MDDVSQPRKQIIHLHYSRSIVAMDVGLVDQTSGGKHMSIVKMQCQVFDPVRITTSASVDNFVIDTWFATGLIARSLWERLPDIEAARTGKLPMSSGMTVDRPIIQVGVQINSIRALPIEFIVVDDGPTQILFGSDFLELLLKVGSAPTSRSDVASTTSIKIEPRYKYEPDSVGLRLIPETGTVDSLQLERFLRGIRKIHNVAVIANSDLHQHSDWPQSSKDDAKRQAVRGSIENDRSLGSQRLAISWMESGSVWLSLKSASKAALSWLSQLFEKSMDARMRSTIAAAASAEEEVAIRQLTREDVARAKNLESRRLGAEQIRRTREEWRKMVLGEIDFRKKISEKIKDPVVKKEAQESIGQAIKDLISSDFLPIVEHVPTISPQARDLLPARKQDEGLQH